MNDLQNLLIKSVNDRQTRPKFGDENLIDALKTYQKEKKAEDEKQALGVKKFMVTFRIWDSADIEVEAVDAEEAKEIAWDEFRDDGLDTLDVDTTVREIKKVEKSEEG